MNEPMSRQAERLVRALEADRPSSEARARMRARMLAATAAAATVGVGSTAAGQGAAVLAKGGSSWLGVKLIVATLVLGSAAVPFVRQAESLPALEITTSASAPARVERAAPLVHTPRVVARSLPEPAPAPHRSPLARERAVLATALRALHARELDTARTALARHRQRFPHGALAPERDRIEQHVNEALGATPSGDEP